MAEKPALKDREIEACLREIAQAREQLGTALRGTQQHWLLNPPAWREWVARYPLETTLGAAALGFILALPASSRASAEGRSLLDDLSRTGIETVLRLAMASFL
jgi:hypothetical protein